MPSNDGVGDFFSSLHFDLNCFICIFAIVNGKGNERAKRPGDTLGLKVSAIIRLRCFDKKMYALFCNFSRVPRGKKAALIQNNLKIIQRNSI